MAATRSSWAPVRTARRPLLAAPPSESAVCRDSTAASTAYGKCGTNSSKLASAMLPKKLWAPARTLLGSAPSASMRRARAIKSSRVARNAGSLQADAKIEPAASRQSDSTSGVRTCSGMPVFGSAPHLARSICSTPKAASTAKGTKRSAAALAAAPSAPTSAARTAATSSADSAEAAPRIVRAKVEHRAPTMPCKTAAISSLESSRQIPRTASPALLSTSGEVSFGI
mmetsp:Transcript_22139/g.75936  ORF Transcript_22139/g.75936 Transcript_22139/m.75936 type:complete len:227 (+) Transcript_22139:518-1198(+)